MLPKKPLQVMEDLGIYDPVVHGPIEPGLRDLVLEVCKGEVTSAAVVGPRGGGKSQGVSFIEFFKVFVDDFDALNLGGSELQADQVYQYLLAYIESDEYWQMFVKGETKQSKTETTEHAWIRVLTASQKSVRSPHAGGRKPGGRMAGGILVIDEEAEAAPDIVEAALPTVNTARPSVVVRSSTFHNNEGTFAELIDNHVEMGFKLYRWDIFDVCERCECVDECESPEPCFREDHYEEFVNPESGEMEQKLLHKAYCGGRAMYANGWIPMEEIHKLFRRMKRNHGRWEVEAMGSRPSSAGFVIKDLMAYNRNIVPESGAQLYLPGSPVSICVDWGSVAAGISVWQEQPEDQHVQLHADLIEEAGQTQIFGVILGYVNMYTDDFEEVAADIGGGGNYMNPKLREEHNIEVRDCNFAEEKEAAAAAWNVYNEADKLKYPADHVDQHHQVRNWKRKKGRIAKGNDHLCDANLCYFSKFIDRLGLRNVRVPPRSFRSMPSTTAAGDSRSLPRATSSEARIGTRRAMVRSIGRRRR